MQTYRRLQLCSRFFSQPARFQHQAMITMLPDSPSRLAQPPTRGSFHKRTPGHARGGISPDAKAA